MACDLVEQTRDEQSRNRVELKSLLVLLHAPGLGPRRIHRLLQHCAGSAEAVLAGHTTLWREAKIPEQSIHALLNPDWQQIERALAWAEHPHAWIITQQDQQYPSLLNEIAAPPLVLFGRGDQTVLKQPQLAIVGSRNPTRDGQSLTTDFAYHLAQAGLTVTSGLALGIDTAAHQGALRGGTTIAVLGTGPDVIYPAANRRLAEQLLERGAYVSEFFPGTKPQAWHFPQRNRLISGLSYGTLVTEAGTRSGSLITARCALDQGREVFAIPGSIHNPLARGCHTLIRQGAKLVETIDDVLEELLPQINALPILQPNKITRTSSVQAPSSSTATPFAPLDAHQEHVLTLLGYDPSAPDDIIARSTLTANEVTAALLLLEIQGYITCHPGGRYSKRSMY
jgi:DNA processing protein